MAGDIANLGAAAPLMQDQYAGGKSSMPSAVKSKPKAKAKKKGGKKSGATKPNPFAKKAAAAPAPSPIAQAMGANC